MDLSVMAQQIMLMQQAQLNQQMALQTTKMGNQQEQSIVDLISQSSAPVAKDGCGTLVDCYA